MSYIASTLVPGESVVTQARVHWFIFATPVFWLILTVLFGVAGVPYGGDQNSITIIVGVLFIFFLIRSIIIYISTELAVTTKRVISKSGFIRRNAVELRYDKVESIHVEQGILGRIFGFGYVTVTGSGGTKARAPFISSPLKFRQAALLQIEGGGMNQAAVSKATNNFSSQQGLKFADRNWYYADSNGSQVGPISTSEVLNLYRQGTLLSTTLLWTEGMVEWMPLSSCASELGLA